MGTFLARNLSASGSQISLAYLTQSLGAIAAPFIIGLLADQFFSAQKVLGILHLAGAALLFWASTMSTFGAFFPVILAYMILYMPTLALVNSVSFRQMTQSGEAVPGGAGAWHHRMDRRRGDHRLVDLGTARTAHPDLPNGRRRVADPWPVQLHAPRHPTDSQRGEGDHPRHVGIFAIALLKNRSYLVFFVSLIAICIPLAFYYNFTNLFLNEEGVRSAAAVQSLGQVSEVLFLLLLPFLVVRLGVKITLAAGMAAWALRYVFFAFGDAGSLSWLLLLGILLHGICYDFFFVAGQIYTNKLAGERIRSAAQGMNLATYGAGILIGSLAAGPIVDRFATADGHDWTQIWIIPAAIAGVVMVLFLILFKDRRVEHATMGDASRTTFEAPGTAVPQEERPRPGNP
jgi:MFS family permease